MFSSIIHGRKVLKLQKYSSLRFVLNPLQNAFAFSSSAQDGCKGKNFTVSYLTDSLGLTTKLAESVLKKVEDKGNAESVLSLLRSHGFSDSHISNIITGYPQLLRLDAENSLAPKLKFLRSRGASSSELAETLSKLPRILRDLGVPQKFLFSLLISGSYVCCGKEKFETSLKKVVGLGFDPTTSKFFEALCIVQGMREETIEEKINAYKKLGLAVEDIWEIFKKYPESLKFSVKKITFKFETLKKCGLREDEILSVFKNFPRCIGVSEQKVMNTMETFLGLGFSRDEFVKIVKNKPQCLSYSVESVKKKIEFVVKKMNWPLKAVVTNYAVLGYSLEKRTIPRCNVITSLMAKGLIGDELLPLSSVCGYTDQMFLKRYVLKYDDKELVAELMATFTGKKTEIDKGYE